jgi:hypothetical protein
MTKTDVENAGQIIRRRGVKVFDAEGEKSRRECATHKDVKNEDRSDYVYENKRQADSLPEKRDDISTQLHDILTKDTRILQKPSALLSLN